MPVATTVLASYYCSSHDRILLLSLARRLMCPVATIKASRAVHTAVRVQDVKGKGEMKAYCFACALLCSFPLVAQSLAFSSETPTFPIIERDVVSRRQWLHFPSLLVATAGTATLTMTTLPPTAWSVGEGTERMVFRQKPTAPVGALLPAVQQRLLLERALDLAQKRDLENLKLILPPLDDTNPIPNANGRQNVRILREFPPNKVLRGDLLRATMNLYQTNLNYNNLLANPNEAFVVTDPDWKKSYIRANDGLPDLQKLIGADIDMRQLLRNQVQVKIDDAAAELYATTTTTTNDAADDDDYNDNNSDELIRLLQEAGQYFDLWLDRIRPGDVRDALQMAMAGKAFPIYDTYAAGFLPPK